MLNRILIVNTAFLFLFLIQGPFVSEAAYTIDTHYEEAVEDFVIAITDATAQVKDAAELDQVDQWETDSRARLPEFLDDLLAIAQALEANGDPDFVFAQYQLFAEKWDAIQAAYPGLEELEVVLGPILDELLNGLPELEATQSDNPTASLSELYVEMRQTNPWALGSFWDLPQAINAQKTISKGESAREITVNGQKSIDIIRRDTDVTLNGTSIFSETIDKNVITHWQVILESASVLHETLDQMIADGAPQEDIDLVQGLVDLVNTNIDLALQDGVVDDCSYSLIFQKEISGSKSTCTDINGQVRDLRELSKYSPEDDVNLVELTHISPFANVTGPALAQAAAVSVPAQFNSLGALPESETAVYSTETIVPFLEPVAITPQAPPVISNAPLQQPSTPAAAWLLGILMPAYIWSATGLIRLF